MLLTQGYGAGGGVITQGYGLSGTTTVVTYSYPGYSDLQAFALSAGIVASTDNHLDYQRVMAAAIRRWESDTNLRGLYSLSLSCPDDVALALLSLGASMLVPQKASANGGAGAVQQIKQDDLQINFAAVSTTSSHYTAQQLQLKAEYDACVMRYKRWVIV